MKVLITGSNGSCAHYLALELGGAMGMARPDCDMLDLGSVTRRLREARPEVIYHLAADADVRGSFDHPGLTFRNNTESTINLFEGCVALGLRPVVVICSTSEVYGEAAHQPIGEEWPLMPLNPYAASKAAQEHIARSYAASHGFPIVITRAFGYINPRRRGLALTSFACQIAEIEAGWRDVVTHGNLDTLRTFCDVRDIVRAYQLCASLRGGVYNIGSETGITVWQCLEALKQLARVPVTSRVDPALIRPSDLKKVVPDCARLRRATGWEPRIALEDSLRWLMDEARAGLQGRIQGGATS